jgi:ribosomal protein S11
MVVVRQPSSLRLIGTIHFSLKGRNNFSAFRAVHNDKPLFIPPSLSPSPPSTPPSTPSPLPSRYLMSDDEAKNETILKFFDDVLGGKKSGGSRSNLSRGMDAFQPVNMSNMPNPASNSQRSTIPLPLTRTTGQRPGYIHIHAVALTKNIHVTITDHKHDPIIAMSAGRLGIKHSRRQTTEAAHATTLAAFEKLANSNYEIQQVELVLKGFGKGRTGFISAVSGPHGEFIRNKVVRVTDATPLQIGRERKANRKRR